MHEQLQEHVSLFQPAQAPGPGEWFAVQTKPRHEKKAAVELEEKDVQVFLPLHNVVHQWSDRRREVQLPLFPNYIFVRIGANVNERTVVLRTNGVRSFVGMRGMGTSVPEEEIDAIQRVLAKKVPFTNYPFLSVGQKVRIRGGSLDGVQGILTEASNDRSLVVSVECIQRSIAIRIDGYGVDPV